MTKAIQQKSVTTKQLKKHLPLLLNNITISRDYLEYYRDVYPFPKMITRQNLKKYKKMIEAIQYILSVIDSEVKKAI